MYMNLYYSHKRRGMKTTQSGWFTFRSVWFRRVREREIERKLRGGRKSEISTAHTSYISRTQRGEFINIFYPFLSMRKMKSIIQRSFSNFFFEYETPRQVLVRNRRVAVACRIIQLGVLSYIIG